MTIHRQCRMGKVASQNSVYDFLRDGKIRRIQRSLWEEWGVAGRMKHDVAITQRHIELAAQFKNHVAAWPRPPGFQEAEMPLGDARIKRKGELAKAAALTPLSY